MKHIYITGSKRTAIGGFMGGFAEVSAPELGSAVAAASIAQAGIIGDEVDEVIFGNVLSAGLGQNVARQVAIGANLKPRWGDNDTKFVDRASIRYAARSGRPMWAMPFNSRRGTENMSRAPYLLEKMRERVIDSEQANSSIQ